MNWNEKALDLMNRQGISQKQLSEITGIAESSLSRYLHSAQKPRMDIIIHIAKALRVEPQLFLDEEDSSENAYEYIATAVARKGNELTPEEQNNLIALILGNRGSV